jgi:hypothetical protein
MYIYIEICCGMTYNACILTAGSITWGVPRKKVPSALQGRYSVLDAYTMMAPAL